MSKVRYHPDARAEFRHEVEYFAAISPRLAQHDDQAVHAAEHQAAESPESWPKYKHGTRRVIDRSFKFSLVYLHGQNEVQVVALAPMKRKPGYWRARLGGG